MINKKGQLGIATKSLFWPLIIFTITIMVLGLAMLMSMYKSQLSTTSPKLEAELISQRFVNIPECFAYQDQNTNRVFSGIIDINKFNLEQLNQCYLTEPEKGFQDFNFKLQLKIQNKELLTNNFFNDIDFTLYQDVIVKNGDYYFKDELAIYVQVNI